MLALELANENPLAAMKHMYMDSLHLKELLSPDDHEKVKRFLSTDPSLKFIARNIERIKPFFLAALIIQSATKEDQPLALDPYLEQLGKNKNKKVMGLETLDEQMAAVNAVPLKEQAALLMETIEQVKDNASILEKMVQLYTDQNINGIARLMEEQELTETMNKVFLTKRNTVMASRIDSLIRQQSVFTAVGTAHLPGKEGLIGLLQARGYQVMPVFSTYSGMQVPSSTGKE